jgi:four helix bundle protein
MPVERMSDATLVGMVPYRRLAVWEKAHQLTLRVFAATEGGALHRFPGLSAQLRRSIAAIPTNIAEGAGHHSQPQFNRFLEIALASAREADYQILLAKDLGLLPAREYAHLEARLTQVQSMLVGLRKRVLESIRTDGALDPREAGKGRRGGRKASPPTTHDP